MLRAVFLVSSIMFVYQYIILFLYYFCLLCDHMVTAVTVTVSVYLCGI